MLLPPVVIAVLPVSSLSVANQRCAVPVAQFECVPSYWCCRSDTKRIIGGINEQGDEGLCQNERSSKPQDQRHAYTINATPETVYLAAVGLSCLSALTRSVCPRLIPLATH